MKKAERGTALLMLISISGIMGMSAVTYHEGQELQHRHLERQIQLDRAILKLERRAYQTRQRLVDGFNVEAEQDGDLVTVTLEYEETGWEGMAVPFRGKAVYDASREYALQSFTPMTSTTIQNRLLAGPTADDPPESARPDSATPHRPPPDVSLKTAPMTLNLLSWGILGFGVLGIVVAGGALFAYDRKIAREFPFR